MPSTYSPLADFGLYSRVAIAVKIVSAACPLFTLKQHIEPPCFALQFVVTRSASRQPSGQTLQVHDLLPPRIVVVHGLDGFGESFGQRRGKSRPCGKIAVAVTVAGPEDAQPALIDRAAGNGALPRGPADRARVR